MAVKEFTNKWDSMQSLRNGYENYMSGLVSVDITTEDAKSIKRGILSYLYNNLDGFGAKSIFALYEAGYDEESIIELSDEELKRLVTNGAKGISIHRQMIKNMCAEMMKCYKNLEKNDSKYKVVPIWDEKYPRRLLTIQDPPYCLNYIGSLPDENMPTIGIVGARTCSSYGSETAHKFAYTMAQEGIQVISGLANGIDGISHKGALDAGGNTYGILGNGVDICYPKENIESYRKMQINGGIISEYHLGVPPCNRFFPARNRIISGLSDALLVVEARKRSGSYITVCQALEQGRDVYAVPGRITDGLSEGCNNLLKDGAGFAVDPYELARNIKETFEDRRLTYEEASLEKFILERNKLKKIDYEPIEDIENEESENESKSFNNLEEAVKYVLDTNSQTVAEIAAKVENAGVECNFVDVINVLSGLEIEGIVENKMGYYRFI